MSASTTLLPFQPMSMSTAQLATLSYLARYSGHTHDLYAHQFRRWFRSSDHATSRMGAETIDRAALPRFSPTISRATGAGVAWPASERGALGA
jgi:hypothetical protein